MDRKTLAWVYVGDVHIREDNPLYRIDNYYKCVLNNLKWVMETYSGYPVIFGGDIGHSAIWSSTMLHDIASILWTEIEDPRPITAVGNHDIEGYSIEDFNWTGLGVLSNWSRVIRVIRDPSRVVAIRSGDRAHYARFIPCTKDYDKGLDLDSLQSDDKASVAVAHLPVGSSKRPWSFGPEELKCSTYDLVMLADIHEEFQVKIGNTLIVNPGPLERLTKSEWKNTPKVAEIHWDSVNGYSCKMVPVAVAPSGKDVFNMEKIKEEEASKKESKNDVKVLESIKELRSQKEMDPKEIVETVGQKLKVKQEVINIVIAEL